MLTLQLVLTVTYATDPDAPAEDIDSTPLSANLEQLVRDAVNDGRLTGVTEYVVDDYRYQLHLLAQTSLDAEARGAYLASPLHCPFCDHPQISAGDIEDGDPFVIRQNVVCDICGEEWTDVYRLVDIEPREDHRPPS